MKCWNLCINLSVCVGHSNSILLTTLCFFSDSRAPETVCVYAFVIRWIWFSCFCYLLLFCFFSFTLGQFECLLLLWSTLYRRNHIRSCYSFCRVHKLNLNLCLAWLYLSVHKQSTSTITSISIRSNGSVQCICCHLNLKRKKKETESKNTNFIDSYHFSPFHLPYVKLQKKLKYNQWNWWSKQVQRLFHFMSRAQIHLLHYRIENHCGVYVCFVAFTFTYGLMSSESIPKVSNEFLFKFAKIGRDGNKRITAS